MTPNQGRLGLLGLSAFVLALAWFVYPKIPVKQRDGIMLAAAGAALAGVLIAALAVLVPWRGRIAGISNTALQPWMYGLMAVLMLVLDLRADFIGAFGSASVLVTLAVLGWAKDHREKKDKD
jgi:hypothetical protein